MPTEILANYLGRIGDEKVRINVINQAFSFETLSIQVSYAVVLAMIASLAIANIGSVLSLVISGSELSGMTSKMVLPVFLLGVSITLFTVVLFGFLGRIDYLKRQYEERIYEFIINT
jgi:hypothetical protein